jgi:hypothetical protein
MPFSYTEVIEGSVTSSKVRKAVREFYPDGYDVEVAYRFDTRDPSIVDLNWLNIPDDYNDLSDFTTLELALKEGLARRKGGENMEIDLWVREHHKKEEPQLLGNATLCLKPGGRSYVTR